MKLHRGFPKARQHQPPSRRIPGRVITLGVFDGVHQGHARVLKVLGKKADQLGGLATVITFADHPHRTLAPARRPPRLATTEQCLTRMQALGVKEIFLVPFTWRLAKMTAENFVERILIQRLQLQHLVVGHDFVFGQGGKGDSRLLHRLAKTWGFGVTEVPALRMAGQVISSSVIRKLVARGEVAQARRFLGWPYTLHGRVEAGEGRGRTLGMPTANLRTWHEIIPAPGVYAVLARLQQCDWPALCYLGRRLTFHPWGPETIEAHIPQWQGSLYGRRLEIRFLKRLRPGKRFSTPQALLAQIKKDWDQARPAWPKGLVVPEWHLSPPSRKG